MPLSCVHHCVAFHADRRPSNIALIANNAVFTYGHLWERAIELAQVLRDRGVEPGTTVGIALERGADQILAVLAVLASGGAYVPLDPGDPAQRATYIVRDAGCALIISDGPDATLHGVAALDIRGWEGSGGAARSHPPVGQTSRGPAAAPPASAQLDDLAYVMYTSGSTGRPKGVQVTHRSVAALAASDYSDLGPDSVIINVSRLAFDASTFEIWGALANGGTLVLAPPGLPDPEVIAGLIARHGVTTMFLTTGVFNLFIDSEALTGSPIRQILTGGDVISAAHVRRALEQMPTADISHVYGLTETTTFSSVSRRVSPSEAARATGSTISLGTPIAGDRAYVLDERLRECPPGVTGELYIAGDGLARGYTSAALTAERFVADPHGDQSRGGRMYRTGDRFRRAAEGSLEFVGRTDHQIKVRGQRTELPEIEYVLREHEGVGEVCCTAHKDAIGEWQIAAHVVLREGTTTGDVRAFARERLPGFMVPAWFAERSHMPLTANGKPDRAALAEAASTPPTEAALAEAAGPGEAGPLEERILRVWARLLNVEPTPGDRCAIGPDDNFFTLGGHSLLAIRSAIELGRELGVDVSPATVMTEPTARRLAAALSRAAAGDRRDATLERWDRRRPAPLSPAQEQIWMLCRLHPGIRAYHFQATLWFHGELDAEALRTALGNVVARNEIYRTTFRDPDGEVAWPTQRVHDPEPFTLPMTDLSALTAPERMTELAEVMRDVLALPFDLSQGPLLRWRLVRLAPDEHALIQVEHHIVHDGASFQLFLGMLAEEYRAALAGLPPGPPADPDYLDYAHWCQTSRSAAVRDAQLSYWIRHLGDIPEPLDLPEARKRPSERTFAGSSFRQNIEDVVRDRIVEYARDRGVSMFAVTFTAFCLLVYARTGRTRFCVGSAMANRNPAEVSGVIGMFVNNVPLVVDLDPGRDLACLLRRAHQTVVDAHENLDVTMREIVDAVSPPRDPGRNPIFDVDFSSHDWPAPDLGLPGVSLSAVEGVPNGTAKFDLNVVALPRYSGWRPGRLSFIWEYNTDLFDREIVEGYAAHYAALLAALTTATPTTPVRDLAPAELPVTPGGPTAEPGVAATEHAPGVQREGGDSHAGDLLGVLSELLGRPVSLADEFFDVGGNSLIAIKASLALRRRDIDVEASEVLRYPRLGELALRLRARFPGPPGPAPPPGPVAPAEARDSEASATEPSATELSAVLGHLESLRGEADR